MFFRRLFSSGEHDHAVRQVYELIVAKARQPALYEELGVADTFEGRFDMLVLFAVLVMRRLGAGPQAARDLGQALFDAMFRDMDRSLREMGVGDLSVGKRVRKLAEIFSGRAMAYRDALAGGSEEQLRRALTRNIYPDGAKEQCIGELASYVTECVAVLDRQQISQLMAGQTRNSHFHARESGHAMTPEMSRLVAVDRVPPGRHDRAHCGHRGRAKGLGGALRRARHPRVERIASARAVAPRRRQDNRPR